MRDAAKGEHSARMNRAFYAEAADNPASTEPLNCTGREEPWTPNIYYP